MAFSSIYSTHNLAFLAFLKFLVFSSLSSPIILTGAWFKVSTFRFWRAEAYLSRSISSCFLVAIKAKSGCLTWYLLAHHSVKSSLQSKETSKQTNKHNFVLLYDVVKSIRHVSSYSSREKRRHWDWSLQEWTWYWDGILNHTRITSEKLCEHRWVRSLYIRAHVQRSGGPKKPAVRKTKNICAYQTFLRLW